MTNDEGQRKKRRQDDGLGSLFLSFVIRHSSLREIVRHVIHVEAHRQDTFGTPLSVKLSTTP